MRRIINSTYMSLDGVVQRPELWTFDYRDDEAAKVGHDQLFSCDALLMGRRTYEGFADVWPSRTDAEGMADRMNSLPKYVVSDSLTQPQWSNTTVINRSEFPARARELKQQPGQNILVAGSATLVQTLVQHNLVDEYHLLVYPVVLGAGKRLFKDGTMTTLKLVETKPFSSGVVALIYQPAQNK